MRSSPGSSWWSRSVVCLLAFGCGCFGLSCRPFDPKADVNPPRLQLVKDGELALYMTRLGTHPRKVVTAKESLPIRVYFDPELVDVPRVKRFTLWGLEADGSTWKRLETADVNRQPVAIQPSEGLLGLRASAHYGDASERLVPQAGDPPAVWVVVDRSAPSLALLSPKPMASVRGVSAVDFRWSLNEAQLGTDPVELAWSADGGRTWKPIAKVPAVLGNQEYAWALPAEVCSDVTVRLKARDLIGHEAELTVPLAYPGSLPPAESLGSVAGATPGVSREAESGSKPAPARSADPGSTAPAVEPNPGESPAAPPSAEPPVAVLPRAESGARAADSSSPALEPEPAALGPLVVEPFEARFLRGGALTHIGWNYTGTRPGTAKVEWSRDGGKSWLAVGEAPLATGRVPWTVPAESVEDCQVRIQSLLEDGRSIEALSRVGFGIDADPPRVAVGDVPRVVGQRPAIPVALSDPGGSGIASIEVHLRREGVSGWTRLPEDRAVLEGSDIRLDLASEPEGPCEVYLRVVDGVGNASPPVSSVGTGDGPDVDRRRLARFLLDRTPPKLQVERGTAPWVSGFPAEVKISADWTQAVPPLALEGREEGGEWTPIGRWTSLAPGQDRFSFPIPADVRAYSVRLSVSDPAGNAVQASLGPEPVLSPIRLGSFTEARAYPEGSMQTIAWQLLPIAQESIDDLQVSVAHLPRQDGGWEKIFDLSPTAKCVWDLPDADREEHRIRVRLLRGGKPLGEAVSERFTIEALPGLASKVVQVSEDSLVYSRQARSQMERYFRALGGKEGVGAEELEQLAQTVRTSFKKALDADKNNYDATYGMAQFLNRTDGERSAAEVSRWLLETVALKPDHAWALNDLGAMGLKLGRYDEAEGYLKKAVEVKREPVIVYNLALSLYYGGKAAAARGELEGLLRSAPAGGISAGEIEYYIILCLHAEGNDAAAKGLLAEAASRIPQDLRTQLQGLLP